MPPATACVAKRAGHALLACHCMPWPRPALTCLYPAPPQAHRFPIIKLERAEFLKTVRGFTFKQGIPNLSPNAYDFRVDPYEPNRVWFTIRTTGTHTGPFTFGRTSIPATGNTIQGPPECCSYTFNAVSGGLGCGARGSSTVRPSLACPAWGGARAPPGTARRPLLTNRMDPPALQEGKVTSFTGGYVMDNRVGNTDGYGAAFGVLAACGIKVPKPNSLQWEVATKLNGLFTAMDKMFGKK